MSASLPTTPLDAGTEFARAAAWERDRTSYRARCGETVTAFLVAEQDAAVAGLATTRATVDQLTAEVRTSTETFETIERRSGRVYESAVRILAEEYDRLAAQPDVASVQVTPEAIVVTTRDLLVVVEGDRWDIGPYRVFLPRTGGISKIRIESVRGNWATTSYGGGRASHPHVFSSHICWGNVSDPIKGALVRCEFDVAFQYVLLMLKTPIPEGESSSIYRNVLEQIGRKLT